MKHLKDHKLDNGQNKNMLTECRAAIERIDPYAEIILYGSRARSDAAPESDYDLLILTNEEVTLKKEDVFRRQLYPIELRTGAVITVLLVSKEDYNSKLYRAMPLYQNIARDGIVL